MYTVEAIHSTVFTMMSNGPSYEVADNVKLIVKLLETRDDNPLNEELKANYKNTRVTYLPNKYRIGPVGLTKDKRVALDSKKQGRFTPMVNEGFNQAKLGLLFYVSTFMNQPELNHIDLFLMKCLLDSGAMMNACDELGQSVLHGLVRDWHQDVVRFALELAADPNLQDTFGRTPLHLAASLDRSDVVQVPLVNNRVKYLFLDPKKSATTSNMENLVLLDNNADPTIQTFVEKQTPVHYAGKHNAVASLQIFFREPSVFECRDYRNRDVLFVATESGSIDAARYLVECNRPVGVYDVDGTSALALMAQNMPSVAALALEQYQAVGQSCNQSLMYLDSFEYAPFQENKDDSKKLNTGVTCVKTPLEIITTYRDELLIMHPVVQKSLEIKWKLYGRKVAILSLISTLLLALIWLATAYLLEDDSAKFYDKSTEWKIVFEVLIVLFSIYFFTREVRKIMFELETHARWKQLKIREINSQYVHCHPSWPNEREDLRLEVEFTESTPNLNEYFWFVFECLQMVLLSGAVVTRVLAVLYTKSWLILILHKIVIGLNVFSACFRVIKSVMKFRLVATCLTTMAGCITSIFQIGFFYLQIYVPFVAVFWLIFGNPKTEALTRRSGNDTNLPRLFYEVFTLSFEQEELFRLEKQDHLAAEISISLFNIFSIFIAFSIIISFIQVEFKKSAIKNNAKTSLSLSNFLLSYEKTLSAKEKRKLRLYYRSKCNPLTVNEPLLCDQLSAAQAQIKIKRLWAKITEIYEGLQQNKKFTKRLEDGEKYARGVYNELSVNINQFERMVSSRGLLKEIENMSLKQDYLSGMIKKNLDNDEQD